MIQVQPIPVTQTHRQAGKGLKGQEILPRIDLFLKEAPGQALCQWLLGVEGRQASLQVGAIQVPIQDRLRTYEAVSRDRVEIPTGQRVKVIDVTPQDVLVVERIE